MASFFKLTLDTTAPVISSITLAGGAQYTTATAINMASDLEDADTTGYQMKIWGVSGAAAEADASWETYVGSKSITLSAGDGLKTISVKVRDSVGNESSAATATITLDTTVPTITITGPDVSVVSKVDGHNTSAFSFVSDVDFVEFKVKVVPATTSLHDAGTAIPTTAGSTNMSGTGTYVASTAVNCTIKGADLESASAGDGVKIIKAFVKNAAGNWSVA